MVLPWARTLILRQQPTRGSLALRVGKVQRPSCQADTRGARHKRDDHAKLISLS